ncbi:Universal stress protein family protein [compost metagenome]
MVVIGGHTSKVKESKHILFPTEFGEHSKDNFRHILKLAKELNAEVTLFHAVARPIESLFDLDTRPKVYNYKGQMLTLEQIVEHQIEHQTQRAQMWIDWAAKEGLVAHFQVDNSFKPIDELVLATVDKLDVDLIVMEAQSGPISAALLGSYTRNVVRQAHCPVYVIPRRFYDKSEDKFADTPAP